MGGHECYHCKQWVEAGEAHDCWTTTERALTQDLAEDLRDAWDRLRETAAGFGEQRIYAAHKSIMFSRRSCYFFVRPKKRFLELCVFLDKPVRAPQVTRVIAASKTRLAHIIQVRHRDQVETPITDWLRAAYDLQDAPPARAGARPGAAGARNAAGAGTAAAARARAPKRGPAARKAPPARPRKT